MHASCLNQVEIYFSILQRKAVSPNNFRDLDELAERITAFQDRYNATAEPFDWTYTRADLNACHALPPISLTADLSQRAPSPASLRRRSAHRRSRICLMSALTCGAGALAVWIGLGLGVGRRLGRHSPMKSPPSCRSRRRTRCHVDGGLSALVAVRLPGGHRVVLVMQPDQPRREPPLDYPNERRSTAPAIRVAATRD